MNDKNRGPAGNGKGKRKRLALAADEKRMKHLKVKGGEMGRREGKRREESGVTQGARMGERRDRAEDGEGEVSIEGAPSLCLFPLAKLRQKPLAISALIGSSLVC